MHSDQSDIQQATEERPIEGYFEDYNKTQVKLLEDSFKLVGKDDSID